MLTKRSTASGDENGSNIDGHQHGVFVLNSEISAKHFDEYLKFGKRTGLKLLEKCLLYLSSTTAQIPLDDFRLIFLLRDSENDL